MRAQIAANISIKCQTKLSLQVEDLALKAEYLDKDLSAVMKAPKVDMRAPPNPSTRNPQMNGVHCARKKENYIYFIINL
jgi:hypothetical protein